MDEMFPLIMSGLEVDEKVSHELEKLGMLSHKNTLYAESTCVDEVNRDNENEDLSLIFSKRFGSVRFTPMFEITLNIQKLNHTGVSSGWIRRTSLCGTDRIQHDGVTCS